MRCTRPAWVDGEPFARFAAEPDRAQIERMSVARRRALYVRSPASADHEVLDRATPSPADRGAGDAGRNVSRMRTATTSPDAKVTPATSQIAASMPRTSAVIPASNAPIA